MEISFKDLKELLAVDTKNTVNEKEAHHLLGKQVVIRTYSAGVHYGTLLQKNGIECILGNAIRIWSWNGAASLSQLSVDGVLKEKEGECKFAKSVKTIDLQWIEILPCEEKAIASIEGVSPWMK